MISFIYFDVGGVMIRDFSASTKWDDMKRDMDISKEMNVKFEAFWDKYADRVDIDCDVDELVPLLRSELGLTLHAEYSWLNDFVDRFEPNYTLWPLVEKIKSKISDWVINQHVSANV